MAKQEWKTTKDIEKKITEHKLIITQTDKGKTIVIIQEQEYNKTVSDFISKTQFTCITQDPTKQYQNNIKQVVKQCPEHIPKNQHWKCYNMNPQTPNLSALVKLHKTPISVRPIINWSNSSAYKLATYLTQILKENINYHLPTT
jgi:hypothetical protein